jgi:AraC family transcriptional regulator
MFSSRIIDWNGVLLEQCQSSALSFEIKLPALWDHWLNLHVGHPIPLIQKQNDRLHKSILHEGNSFLAPAGQPSYWCRNKSGAICTPLYICLKPELIQQVAKASDIDSKRFDLVPCFSQQDLQLH